MNEHQTPVADRLPRSPSLCVNDGSGNATDITLRRLVHFLLGSRTAIQAFASRRDTFWLGLVFVISAGFVREHHQANWLQKPWLILLPLVATVLLSLIVFPLTAAVARVRGASGGNYLQRFRVFLSLLWMTAPLAWIFILPVEQVMSPDDATIIKLWFLGMVSMWRMFLVTRILSTLFVPRAGEMIFTGTSFLVLLIVDTLVLCRFGGDRLVMMVGNTVETPAADFMVIHAIAIMSVLGMITWPIWLVGTLMVALGEGSRWSWTIDEVASPRRFSVGIKVLATASLLIWVLLLPAALGQHAQQGTANDDPSGRVKSLPQPVELNAARVQSLH